MLSDGGVIGLLAQLHHSLLQLVSEATGMPCQGLQQAGRQLLRAGRISRKSSRQLALSGHQSRDRCDCSCDYTVIVIRVMGQSRL